MTIGLSLTSTSANSDSPNSTRKIHSDQKPRRLRLKLASRRWLIGDRTMNFLRGGCVWPGAGSVVASAFLSSRSSIFASTSDLARLEIDARIDPRVGEVGD